MGEAVLVSTIQGCKLIFRIATEKYPSGYGFAFKKILLSQKSDEPINVIYQTAEDGPGDTIKPRLLATGADCERVLVIDESSAELTLSDERIEQAIRETGAKMIAFALNPESGFEWMGYCEISVDELLAGKCSLQNNTSGKIVEEAVFGRACCYGNYFAKGTGAGHLRWYDCLRTTKPESRINTRLFVGRAFPCYVIVRTTFIKNR